MNVNECCWLAVLQPQFGLEARKERFDHPPPPLSPDPSSSFPSKAASLSCGRNRHLPSEVMHSLFPHNHNGNCIYKTYASLCPTRILGVKCFVVNAGAVSLLLTGSNTPTPRPTHACMLAYHNKPPTATTDGLRLCIDALDRPLDRLRLPQQDGRDHHRALKKGKSIGALQPISAHPRLPTLQITRLISLGQTVQKPSRRRSDQHPAWQITNPYKVIVIQTGLVGGGSKLRDPSKCHRNLLAHGHQGVNSKRTRPVMEVRYTISTHPNPVDIVRVTTKPTPTTTTTTTTTVTMTMTMAP